jgi:hypothetical protein
LVISAQLVSFEGLVKTTSSIIYLPATLVKWGDYHNRGKGEMIRMIHFPLFCFYQKITCGRSMMLARVVIDSSFSRWKNLHRRGCAGGGQSA